MPPDYLFVLYYFIHYCNLKCKFFVAHLTDVPMRMPTSGGTQVKSSDNVTATASGQVLYAHWTEIVLTDCWCPYCDVQLVGMWCEENCTYKTDGTYANTCMNCNACENHKPICSECYLCADCGCTHGIGGGDYIKCICKPCTNEVSEGSNYCTSCDAYTGCMYCGTCVNHISYIVCTEHIVCESCQNEYGTCDCIPCHCSGCQNPVENEGDWCSECSEQCGDHPGFCQVHCTLQH